MRIRGRHDAKTRCLYPSDDASSTGSTPKPQSVEEAEEVSLRPATAELPKEKDSELKRRKYKNVGWPSSVTFSFHQTKTPTEGSSTNPDNSADYDEVRKENDKHKKRLSKSKEIGVGDEKGETCFDSKLRNAHAMFLSITKRSTPSSYEGGVKGVVPGNKRSEKAASEPGVKAQKEKGKTGVILVEGSGDSEQTKIRETRGLQRIYNDALVINLDTESEEDDDMPLIHQFKKLKRNQGKTSRADAVSQEVDMPLK